MATLLVTHKDCIGHEAGAYHPERPARLTAILEALEAPEFRALLRVEAPLASLDSIALLHPIAYVEAVLAAIPKAGLVHLDADTAIGPGSGLAARRAVGAVLTAVDRVVAGEANNAFCAVRPPGHHAEPGRPMGFCLFNNVAIGAAHARAAHGLKRVAVVDFDVHHGNGTQAAFEREPDLFFASTHQMPLYPGTGAAGERGVGNIVNVPLEPGDGSEEFRAAYESRILPALAVFRPELILVSAGFDAHRDDPLAGLNLVEADFGWATEKLLQIAAAQCRGRLVSTLEGGYDLDALAQSAAAHVRALLAA
jgi:acetoin utilization deacetylase AcuC-like enzyme